MAVLHSLPYSNSLWLHSSSTAYPLRHLNVTLLRERLNERAPLVAFIYSLKQSPSNQKQFNHIINEMNQKDKSKLEHSAPAYPKRNQNKQIILIIKLMRKLLNG